MLSSNLISYRVKIRDEEMHFLYPIISAILLGIIVIGVLHLVLAVKIERLNHKNGVLMMRSQEIIREMVNHDNEKF